MYKRPSALFSSRHTVKMNPNARENMFADLVDSARRRGNLDHLMQSGTLLPFLSNTDPHPHATTTALTTALAPALQGATALQGTPVGAISGPLTSPSGSGALLANRLYTEENRQFATPSGSTSFQLPGWGYTPPASNTPNRHSDTLGMRNNLFQPYNSPGHSKGKKPKKNFVNVPKCFDKIIVALRTHQTDEYPIKPSKHEVFELSCLGIGEKVVEFSSSDDVNTVLHKIIAAFEPYSMIKGGIQMFVQASKGNAAQLVRCTNPLLTGAQMRSISHTKIYVAPLQEEQVQVQAAFGAHDVTCIDCGEIVNALQLTVHKEQCKDVSQHLGPLNPEGWNMLANLKQDQMNATVGLAREDERLRNFIEVNRVRILDDAIELTGKEEFMSKLSYPLTVKFVGEPGVDLGAVCADFLWKLLDKIESTFDSVINAYKSAPLTTDSEDEMSHSQLSKRLFAYGVFCGISVIQLGITIAFIKDAVEKVGGAENVGQHPFLKGLNVQKVADLILNNACVRAIFADIPLTTEVFMNHVEFSHVHHDDLLTGMVESSSKEHFVSFLKNVEQKNVDFASKGRKMTLEDVLMFCAGTRKFGLDDEPKIEASFILSPRRSLIRPSTRACTGKLTLPMTSTAGQMESVFIEAIESNDGFTFA